MVKQCALQALALYPQIVFYITYNRYTVPSEENEDKIG